MNLIRKTKFLTHLGPFLIKVSMLFFQVTLITFIFYFALENIKTGLISNHFDLNVLLVLAAISGVVTILFNREGRRSKLNWTKLILFIILSALAGLASFQSLQNLEKMRYLISLLVTIICFIILISHYQTNYD